jgi:predicted amidophosphoribosyltransferase
MDQTNSQAAAEQRCPSCGGNVGAADKFCRQCGVRLQNDTSPNGNVHERLGAIERRLLHILLGIGVLAVIIGWIALQLYHFGKGGILG